MKETISKETLSEVYTSELNSTYAHPLIRIIEDELKEEPYDRNIIRELDMYTFSISVDVDTILKYSDGFVYEYKGYMCKKKWNLKGLSFNLSLDEDFILNRGNSFLAEHKYTLCMNILSRNPNISLNFMHEFQYGIENVIGGEGMFNVTTIIVLTMCERNEGGDVWDEYINDEGMSGETGERCLFLDEDNLVKPGIIVHSQKWNTFEMLRKTSIDILEEMVEHSDISEDYAQAVTCNFNLTPSFILNNKLGILCGTTLVGWDMNVLSANPAIPFKFILDYPAGFGCGGWTTYELSNRIDITLEFIFEYSQKVFVLKQEYPEWDMVSLSRRIPARYILDNPAGLEIGLFVGRRIERNTERSGKKIKWDVEGLTERKKWHVEGLMSNPMKDLSKSDILLYIQRYFPYEGKEYELSINHGITPEFIYEYPGCIKDGKSWSSEGLVCNPNIDYEFLVLLFSKKIKTYESINIGYLCGNPYSKVREAREEYICTTKEKAARVIWYNGWIPYYYSPKRVGKGFDKDKEVFQEHLSEI